MSWMTDSDLPCDSTNEYDRSVSYPRAGEIVANPAESLSMWKDLTRDESFE